MDFDTSQILGIILGVIGAVSGLWYIYEKLVPMRRLSWRFAQKAALAISNKLVADDFVPSLIVGIGRGGAIMGAFVSGCLGHRPLLVIDRDYSTERGHRIVSPIGKVDLDQHLLDKVLLIAGEVNTGNTMRAYHQLILDLGAKAIRKACLRYRSSAVESVDYSGLVSDKNLRLPWMFTDRYYRDDRLATKSPS